MKKILSLLLCLFLLVGMTSVAFAAPTGDYALHVDGVSADMNVLGLPEVRDFWVMNSSEGDSQIDSIAIDMNIVRKSENELKADELNHYLLDLFNQNVPDNFLYFLDIVIELHQNGILTNWISNTNVVLEIKLPMSALPSFDPQNADKLGVHRCHDGDAGYEYHAFQRITTKPGDVAARQDQTFYADDTNLYIYSSKYSLFAVSYPEAGGTPPQQPDNPNPNEPQPGDPKPGEGKPGDGKPVDPKPDGSQSGVPGNPTTSSVPKTGDDSLLGLWMVLMVLSGAGIWMMQRRKIHN